MTDTKVLTYDLNTTSDVISVARRDLEEMALTERERDVLRAQIVKCMHALEAFLLDLNDADRNAASREKRPRSNGPQRH